MQRNTFSPDELVKIADMLEMEVAFVDKSVKLENGSKFAIVGSEESAD